MISATEQRIRDTYLQHAAHEQDAATQCVTNILKFCELTNINTGYAEIAKRALQELGVIIERERFTS